MQQWGESMKVYKRKTTRKIGIKNVERAVTNLFCHDITATHYLICIMFHHPIHYDTITCVQLLFSIFAGIIIILLFANCHQPGRHHLAHTDKHFDLSIDRLWDSTHLRLYLINKCSEVKEINLCLILELRGPVCVILQLWSTLTWWMWLEAQQCFHHFILTSSLRKRLERDVQDPCWKI